MLSFTKGHILYYPDGRFIMHIKKLSEIIQWRNFIQPPIPYTITPTFYLHKTHTLVNADLGLSTFYIP